MSILTGILRDSEAKVHEHELRALASKTRQYASDDPEIFVQNSIGMSVQLYRSHGRSLKDGRPFRNAQGNLLCLDGRIDNFRMLSDQIGMSPHFADSSIVLAAFERWGEACFSRFTGEWALALWHDEQRTLYLARDHAGTRSLYFAQWSDEIVWATYLDTFKALGRDLGVSREYAAAYLSCTPVRDRTPYSSIRAVKPGHYTAFRDGKLLQKAHWSPLIRSSISYKQDAEYDEHFLSLFETAVQRRTGPGEPILAQLSGGMDSTSLVCMSDHIRRRGNPHAEILDTLSYFNDSEASLDEKRYFLITEERRGKCGTHLEIVSSERSFQLPPPPYIYLIPGSDRFSLKLEQWLYEAVWQRGYRSVLSGIGGDEVLGGVPFGLPELSDYLVSGRLWKFLHRAVAWSLPDRTPLVSTVRDTAKWTARLYLARNPKRRLIPASLSADLQRSFWDIEKSNDVVPHRIGIAPHRLENAFSWWHIMETLPHLSPQVLFRPEYRYPMLDKDLVEFLFAIPPTQLVQPGRRRTLMRRALRGIVPTEILERRRKAFQLRASVSAIQNAHDELRVMFADSIVAQLGFLDVDAFLSDLQATVNGDARWYQFILRIIAYELWLRMSARCSEPIQKADLMTLAAS